MVFTFARVQKLQKQNEYTGTLHRDESVAVVACKAMCNFALRKNGLKDFFSDVTLCDKIELLESRCDDDDDDDDDDDGDLRPVLRHLTKLLCGQKKRGK